MTALQSWLKRIRTMLVQTVVASPMGLRDYHLLLYYLFVLKMVITLMQLDLFVQMTASKQ